MPIDYRTVADLPRRDPEPHRRKRFTEIADEWRAGDDESGFGVSAKRLLQDSSELGLSVWDVLLAGVRKGFYDFSQRSEAAVDLVGLSKCLAFDPGPVGFFGTGQIHQEEFASAYAEFEGILLCDRNNHDEMGTGRPVVLSSRHGSPVLDSIVVVAHELLSACDEDFSDSFNKGSSLWLRTNFQIQIARLEQIADLLQVYLNHRHL